MTASLPKLYFKPAQISVFVCVLLSGCYGTKFLNQQESLIVSQEITGITGSLKDNAEGLYDQKPNARLLSVLPVTHLAYLYKLGENGWFFGGYNQEKVITKKEDIERKYDKRIVSETADKKKRKLRSRKAKKVDQLNRKIREGNRLMRWGEELAIYKHTSTIESLNRIKRYMNTKGYLNAEVKYDSGFKFGKKNLTELKFRVKPGSHYYIDSIQYQIEDTVLMSLLMNETISKKAPLKKGFYDQNTLTKQRDYLFETAVNEGYFDFSKQYISFQVDSSRLSGDTLIVREVIKNPEDKTHHSVFRIDSIVFIGDAGRNIGRFARKNTAYNGITFSFSDREYSKKILDWRILLNKGDLYSKDLTIETQRQLLFLDNFKFVNINYDTTDGKFLANIFTSPFKKYQTTTEFGLTSTQGFPGPFFNLNLKNRNSFRGMEIIGLNASMRLEDLRSVLKETNREQRYSSRQFGGEISITFPQFLIPKFRNYKEKTGLFNPKSKLSFGVNFEDRDREYTRTTYRSTFQYAWQVKDRTRYTLNPIQISLIDSDNTPEFQTRLDTLARAGNTFVYSFRSSVITGTSFKLDKTLGDYANYEDGLYLSLYGESGGHFNNIIGKRTFGEALQYFNYFKISADVRKIQKVSRNLNIAYRLNIGVAVPYGDSLTLPYEKYHFAGGSNSIRAWRPRRLGPGAFATYLAASEGNASSTGGYNQVNYAREQSGELIIESSFEFRQNLVGLLEAAFFVDAGNVWLIRGTTVDPLQDGDGALDDGRFRFRSFLSEVALGTGVGLRFDLSFLIFRLDMGFKVMDPAQPRGNRFVLNSVFSNFSDISTLNIGIGYPF